MKSKPATLPPTQPATQAPPTMAPPSSVKYRSCISQNCLPGHFCANKCWTGKCGNDEGVSAGVSGNYCQPCVACRSAVDSLDGSCAACELNPRDELIPRAASPFPTCKDDLDCSRFGVSSSTKQFCATKCFSGYCGPDAKEPKDAPGKFCQPCMTCQDPSQAVSGSCAICGNSRKPHAAKAPEGPRRLGWGLAN